MTPRERRAWAMLTGLVEPGDLELWQVVAQHGPVETVARVAAGRYPGRRGADLAVRLGSFDPDRALATVEGCGGRLICPGDPEWPSEAADVLGSIAEDELAKAAAVGRACAHRGGPPLALWARGPADLGDLTRRSCAVVGSRAATDYGIYVASELGAGLAGLGVAVVSGGAYGIDAAAHRGALTAEGHTIAVLACGVDVAYPPRNERLLTRIASEGLLLSEVPPGATPIRPRFLVRNRLIAVLTQGTVVVEATLRSGALNTAGWAEAASRQVMGVPGPVTSDRSSGVHNLLRGGGALLITGAEEVAEQIGEYGSDLLQDQRGGARTRDLLPPRDLRVLEAVPVVRGTDTAEIAVAAGIDSAAVAVALGRLLLMGYVEKADSGWRLSSAERRALGGSNRSGG